MQNVDPELKNDREIVLAAVKGNGFALKHADPELKKDREKIGLDHVASVPERRRMYGWTFQRVRIPARSILRTIRYSWPRLTPYSRTRSTLSFS